jgi:hypothetical protein
MMMGQPEAVIQQAHAEALAAPEVQDDFDIGAEDEVSLQVRSALAGLDSNKDVQWSVCTSAAVCSVKDDLDIAQRTRRRCRCGCCTCRT